MYLVITAMLACGPGFAQLLPIKATAIMIMSSGAPITTTRAAKEPEAYWPSYRDFMTTYWVLCATGPLSRSKTKLWTVVSESLANANGLSVSPRRYANAYVTLMVRCAVTA
jgi:hypothetical protein